MALALIFFFIFGAFILIPGGCAFFHFGAAGLTAAFAPSGAALLMTTTKELAFAALQLQLLTFFGEVFSAAVEAFVIAAPDGIDVHGVRVPCLGPFCRPRLYEIEELPSAPCLLEVFLKVCHHCVVTLF